MTMEDGRASMTMDPLLIACAAFFCITVSLLLHRSHRRRLRLPPGPMNLPVIGSLPFINPPNHVGLAKLAERYGPIMFLKIGTSNVVVASSAAAARTFLKTHDLKFADRPITVSIRDSNFDGHGFISSSHGPYWKLIRKLLHMHMLGVKALSSLAAIRRDELEHMLRSMHEASRRSRPVVAPLEMMICAQANMLGRVMLSRRVFEEVEGGGVREFKEAITELLVVLGQFNVGDFVTALAPLDLQGTSRRIRGAMRRLGELLDRLIAEHEATAHERQGTPDFLDFIIANRVDAEGQAISDVNIKSIIQDIFIAGTDTSAVTVEWALAEMLKNPAILKRAQKEMDEVIGRERRLEESDIPKLPYLHALCKETFRLHPSTPLGVPHLAAAACEVAGHYIPANTRLIVNIWAIGRDPSRWDSPLEFRPERFLSGKDAEVEPLGGDWELIPFGGGRRICAGMNLAMTVVPYFLGMLVHSFDWRVTAGSGGDQDMNMDEKFGAVVSKAIPLNAMISPRLAHAAYV